MNHAKNVGTEDRYAGKWVSGKTNLGIMLEINYAGTNVRIKPGRAPYQTTLVDGKGRIRLSLTGHIYGHHSTPVYLKLIDFVIGTEAFEPLDPDGVRKLLRERGVAGRMQPHYRRAYSQIKEFYKRVEGAKAKVEELNEKLARRFPREDRAKLFESTVGKGEFFNREFLEVALEVFGKVVK